MPVSQGTVLSSTGSARRLAVASPRQIDQILSESHALWGAGLSLADYRGMWADLRATAWGRRWFAYQVWTDEAGELLSSFKLYRPEIRLAERTTRACGIGAVFTPRRHRGRGHASAMLLAALEEARRRRDGLALLFSDIGTGFYESLGFRALPCEELSGDLSQPSPLPAPGWRLRPMVSGDLDEVVGTHRAWCEARPMAIQRDREHWDLLVERARTYFARLDGSSLSTRYQVALRDGRFAGYAIGVESDGEWNLREAEASSGEPADLRAILLLAAAAARVRGSRQLYGWVPREVAALVPEWDPRFQPRTRAIPMVLALRPEHAELPFDSPASAFVPFLDQF